MRRSQKFTPTRRTLLSAIGASVTTGLGATSFAAEGQRVAEHVLVQGDRCVPVKPFSGQQPVEAFYEYQLPRKYVSDANGATAGSEVAYGSAGTTDVQRPQTSIAFLYQGPEGLSLVVVHGSAEASDGGSVTFRISGLSEDGEWVVKDDLYRNPDSGELLSYDQWRVEGTEHRIDWTWGSGGTDGGAFRGLGDDFSVVVDPAFNDAATLHGQHYEGTVTDWQFLTGSADSPERVSLSKDERVLITTDGCDAQFGSSDEQSDDEDGDGETEDESEDEESEDEGDEGTYTVCHEPPGNPDNARTIQVGSKSALEAHLAHGDERGSCEGE